MAAKTQVQNPQITTDGDILTIVIDMSQTQGKSSSGKSEIVASTHGNVLVGNGLKLGLNCYRPV